MSILWGIHLCQILQWACYGLLGFWELECNLPFFTERAWKYSSEIPLNWQQSTQELARHNTHKGWLLLKKTAKWFTLFHFKPPFLFSPLRKKNQRKRRNKITLVSPYTLSDMFSYYVYKIRKLCPFLHYWVINLSSLSGSPVKPSSKMNYGCRQQSGACMSPPSLSMYVQTNKPVWVYTRVSVHITYPPANEK